MGVHDDAGFRRVHASALPVTGAWRPGDPPGARRFLRLPADRPFVLEGGGLIEGGVDIAYETWGRLRPDASNAVLVCHAITGDSHVAGPLLDGHKTPGWWAPLVGPGRALDTDDVFVVCVNVLGGCQGTTGPAHPHPADGKPWGSRFPVVSIRDMVRTQAAVADHLGVARWRSVVGGSMGGMQVLEWATMYPERVGSIVPIATCAAATAQQIGWWSTGRRIIRNDPEWRGGDYYDAEPGGGPHEGLALARMVSQITFRTDDVFTDRFGRAAVEPLQGGFSLWQRFEVERYLEYHGDKLTRRFDANSYVLLSKAMDLHDIGRGRGGVEAAVARMQGPVLAVGVSSDFLYPSYQSREVVDLAIAAGLRSEYAEIDSAHGHDAFLLEVDQVAEILTKFLSSLEVDP
ncbi:MAG: homoserine O-acetyltransferase [Actinomycetota bacterium]|nr:homoserine O-acetyltransferase [Acidimicrobiia bacterium]MDQ3294358.1 homoserine O-acetyltransferase [Actinomycetota bacterium]